MKKTTGKYEIDMCSGPIFKKVVLFALPLMLSGILQLLYNAADIVVVGQFAGSQALAAVGSTSSLINLLTNVFIGLSMGVSVLISKFYGAGQQKDIYETVHTAIALSLICGILIGAVGIAFARPLLHLMGTPDDVLSSAAAYLQIFFMGMPAFMLYNFGSAALRAVGDTRRPLYYLTFSGIINILLNLLFVISFKLDVKGVALATIISQFVSAALIVWCLTKTDGCCRLDLKHIRIYPKKLLSVLRIGLPAGIQGSLFSVSNVLIQSSVNSFQSVAMAGNTAAANLEGFVYTSMNAMSQASLAFTSQNYGAGHMKRIKSIMWICMLSVSVLGLVMGNAFALLGGPLSSIYSPDPDVIAVSVSRLNIVCTTYFLCGAMEVMVGLLRGMGQSLLPTAVSLMGACVFRIIWIYTVFASNRTLTVLYISYPVSWIITVLVHLVCYFFVYAYNKKKYDKTETDKTNGAELSAV